MLTVRKAKTADAALLAPRLREADVTELNITITDTIEETLLRGINDSAECFVAVSEGDIPEIVFGVVPSGDPDVGFIWMVGTDAIEANWVQVIRETRAWLDKVFGRYKLLTNSVYSDNTVHIRWLRWAGFSFLREAYINHKVFYEFATLNKQEVT